MFDDFKMMFNRTALGGFNPAVLFSGGEAGAWYDTSDLSTMYQDSAGTTVAVVGQPVGLLLDKRLGGPGLEIKNSGALALVGVATAATYNTTTGAGSVTRVDGTNQSFVTWTGLAGFYKLTVTLDSGTGLAVRSGAQAGTTIHTLTSVGQSVTFYVPDTGGQISITSSGGTATFTVASFKPLPGNHATQATTAAKPVLRQHYDVAASAVERLTNGDFGAGAASWVVAGADATHVATFSGGTLRFQSDTTTPILTVTQSGAYEVGKAYEITVVVSAAASGAVKIDSGGITSPNLATVGTHKFNGVATGTALQITRATATTDITIDSISVKEATANGYYLEHDGVDDWLRSTFTIAQPWDRVSAVQQISWTNADQLFGSGSGTTAGVLYQATGSPRIYINSGAVGPSTLAAEVGANAVITERHNGASSRIAANNAAYATQEAGASVPGGVTIGASGAGAAASNIRFYGTIMIGRALTITETDNLRSYFAVKAGIAIHNLLQKSQDFTDAVWIKLGATVTADAASSPDGTTTADKLVETAVNSQHRLTQAIADAEIGAMYTGSIYVKAAERTKVWIRLIGVVVSSGAIVELTDGTMSSVTGTISRTNVGNGWWRIVVTGAASTATPSILANVVDAAGATTYLGDGTSGILLWGAQLEKNSTATIYNAT